MTTETQLVTIVEKPKVILQLAALVLEHEDNLANIEAANKAGLYATKDAYECDFEDANDSHLIALAAYQAALSLMRGKRIDEEQQSQLECALCLTGSL